MDHAPGGVNLGVVALLAAGVDVVGGGEDEAEDDDHGQLDAQQVVHRPRRLELQPGQVEGVIGEADAAEVGAVGAVEGRVVLVLVVLTAVLAAVVGRALTDGAAAAAAVAVIFGVVDAVVAGVVWSAGNGRAAAAHLLISICRWRGFGGVSSENKGAGAHQEEEYHQRLEVEEEEEVHG